MGEKQGLLSGGYAKVVRNKRYIFWFWVLNLTLALCGVMAFRQQAHVVLDNSLYSGGLVRGFDLGVFLEMLSRPELGPMKASRDPALFSAGVFFVFTVLLLPGVFLGYASNYRLPRDEFFRASGRNLWRFIRLLIVSGVVMGGLARLLFFLHELLENKAAESTNELLLPEVQFAGLVVIFLVMTCLRIWFDLAEADVVLSDQNAVRKSIGAAFRHTWRHWVKLLSAYVVTTIVAVIILAAGIWVWRYWVGPEHVKRAFVVSQLTLFLLLIPRFWQRGIAVAHWQHKMMVHAPAQPLAPPVAAASGGVPVPG